MAETTATDREALGRIVRETWVKWAKEQSNPKGHWIVTWDALDAGQREVDMRIGEAVQAAALARERQRVTVLRKAAFDVLESCVPSPDDIPEAETRLTDRGKERVRALWRAIKDVDPPVTG